MTTEQDQQSVKLPNHYIPQKVFLEEIKKYLTACSDAEAENKEIPTIPDSIGRQFIVLATRLANRYNFVNYTFKDEMISDAIAACCAKIRKFDPSIGNNAFAYFTSVCWREFVDYIKYEQKNSYIKAKMMQSIDYTDMLDEVDLSSFEDDTPNIVSPDAYFDIDEYESKLEAAKIAAKNKKLENSNSLAKPKTTVSIDME